MLCKSITGLNGSNYNKSVTGLSGSNYNKSVTGLTVEVIIINL